MRHMMTMAAVAALIASGFTAISSAPATAQSTKKKVTRKAPVRKMDPGLQKMLELRGMTQEGGPVGCSNGPVRDRAGRVLKRLGGEACPEDAPKPVPQTITRAWLIGVWVSADRCADAEFPIRLRGDGSYERVSDAGTWKLASSAITFSYRDTEAAGGEMITADMERSLPIRSNTIRIQRLADDRMRFGSYTVRRCSTNPDADLTVT